MVPILGRRSRPLTRNAILAAATRVTELSCQTGRERELLVRVHGLVQLYGRCATTAAVENLTDDIGRVLYALGIMLAEQHGHADAAITNLSLAAESSIRDSAMIDRARIERWAAEG